MFRDQGLRFGGRTKRCCIAGCWRPGADEESCAQRNLGRNRVQGCSEGMVSK